MMAASSLSKSSSIKLRVWVQRMSMSRLTFSEFDPTSIDVDPDVDLQVINAGLLDVSLQEINTRHVCRQPPVDSA